MIKVGLVIHRYFKILQLIMRTRPVSRPCPQFVFLSEEEKRRLSLNHVKPSEAWFSGLVILVLYCQTGFLKVSLYTWAHCIKDTAIRPGFKMVSQQQAALAQLLHVLDSCRVFLEYPKIKQMNERLCLQGADHENSEMSLNINKIMEREHIKQVQMWNPLHHQLCLNHTCIRAFLK